MSLKIASLQLLLQVLAWTRPKSTQNIKKYRELKLELELELEEGKEEEEREWRERMAWPIFEGE